MELGEDGSWLWLSGGTDWQGFQGGFRQISTEGARPAWVTFRVRIATPQISGAYLALYAGQRTWGFTDPVLVFNYRGGEVPVPNRCFALQTGCAGSQQSSAVVTHHSEVLDDVSSDRAYEVAIHLDWARMKVSLFVDGRLHILQEPLVSRAPIRYATIYNWRSQARTGFSEVTIGDACPSAAVLSLAAKHLSRRAASRTATLACPCRNGKSPSLALRPLLAWLGAILALAMAASAAQLLTSV